MCSFSKRRMKTLPDSEAHRIDTLIHIVCCVLRVTTTACHWICSSRLVEVKDIFRTVRRTLPSSAAVVTFLWFCQFCAVFVSHLRKGFLCLWFNGISNVKVHYASHMHNLNDLILSPPIALGSKMPPKLVFASLKILVRFGPSRFYKLWLFSENVMGMHKSNNQIVDQRIRNCY